MRKILLLSVCTLALTIYHNSAARAQTLLEEVPTGTENHTISADLLQTISDVLPEERGRIDPNFLNRAYDPNIYLSASSQLAVSFVSEGAGYRNSLGYFTFDDNSFSGLSFGDIDTDSSGIISTSEIGAVNGVTTSMVFPNTSLSGSGGRLNQGDTYVLGGGSIDFTDDSWMISDGTVFEADTNVGFFLAANAWNDYGGGTGTVDGWDGVAGDPYTYYTLDFLNPENNASASFDSNDFMTRHVALTFESQDRNTLIMGFEDLYNLGDADFNDTIFVVRSDPTGAMSGTPVEVYSAPGPIAGGGLIGLAFLLGLAGFSRKIGLPLAN